MKFFSNLLPSVIIAVALVASSYILYMGCRRIARNLDFYELQDIANAIERVDTTSYFPNNMDITLHPNTVGNVFPVSIRGYIDVP